MRRRTRQDAATARCLLAAVPAAACLPATQAHCSRTHAPSARSAPGGWRARRHHRFLRRARVLLRACCCCSLSKDWNYREELRDLRRPLQGGNNDGEEQPPVNADRWHREWCIIYLLGLLWGSHRAELETANIVNEAKKVIKGNRFSKVYIPEQIYENDEGDDKELGEPISIPLGNPDMG
ncbi:hypothetical protein MRX96_008540 [Rhipicephalus microplus]